MTPYLDEAQVEIATVDYFRELGYEYVHGPSIAPDGERPEQEDYDQVVVLGWLRDTLLHRLLRGEVEVPLIEDEIEEDGN